MSISLSHISLNSFLSQSISINRITNCSYIEKGAYDYDATDTLANCRYDDEQNFKIEYNDKGEKVCQKSSNSGGAINIEQYSSLTLTYVNFTNCSCALRGGAVYVDELTKLLIDNCIFSHCYVGAGNCHQGSAGAALCIIHSDETIIKSSQFLNNRVIEGIGATSVILIYDDIGKTVTQIIDTKFDNNPNVEEDIYVKITNSESKLTIFHSCFKSQTLYPFILVDFDFTLECKSCSFYQKKFTPTSQNQGSYNSDFDTSNR